MRYEKGRKDATRQRIIDVASGQFRAHGVAAAGLSGIMTEAGLTNGAFYAHFDSKEDLVAQAITHMFDTAHNRFLSLTEGRDPATAIASYVEFYLSPPHRLERANGCPIATLSGDLHNLSDRARERFTGGTERVAEGLAKLAKKLGAKDPKALAWSAMAEMSGALALSRTVSDEQAEAILRHSRASVKARFGLGAR